MVIRSEYDEAILSAGVSLHVSDPELLGGKVETERIGSNNIPRGVMGRSAVVYKFLTRSGQTRALRFFIRPIDPTIKQRYELMGPYFRQSASRITVDFIYYEQGIVVTELVNGQRQEQVWPVIDMEWVAGETLFDHLEKVSKAGNRAALGNLAKQWLEILQELSRAKIAHGNLTTTNVMVRWDGRLVLVDYDSVYIPHFRGLRQLSFGTPGFQHPMMTQRTFDEWMDEFSGLLIYTALLALQAQPELWQKYIRYSPSGKALDATLLFTWEDLQNPQQSRVFAELEQSPDAQVRVRVQELKRACTQPINQVGFLMRLLATDFGKQASQPTQGNLMLSEAQGNNTRQPQTLIQEPDAASLNNSLQFTAFYPSA